MAIKPPIGHALTFVTTCDFCEQTKPTSEITWLVDEKRDCDQWERICKDCVKKENITIVME